MKKGEPFQKAIEQAYLKDHEKKSSSDDFQEEQNQSVLISGAMKEKLEDEASQLKILMSHKVKSIKKVSIVKIKKA